MSNRLEALQFLLRDAEGVATLAAVINGKAELQQTLIMMCPAFAPRPAPNPLSQFSIPAPSYQQVPMPLNSPGGYMSPFNMQGPPLTPTPQFTAPMPVCPKCHHSYGPERMAIHVKVCGGSLDVRSDGLRSPTIGFGRTLSSNGLDQLSRESSISLDEHPSRLLIAKEEVAGRLVADTMGRGSFDPPGGAFDQTSGGGSRRNSLTEIPRSPYAVKDDKPVGRAGGAYVAKDDQPIGGARAANSYTAKDDQPIGGARRGNFEEPPQASAFSAKEDRPVGGGRGVGAYAAKDDQPIGGRSGTGAFAAKEEQPIGGARRRSVKEESPPVFTDGQDQNRAGTGAYLAKDEQPIGSARRRSVKEERPPFSEPVGGGAYLAKDDKPVGGGSRGASASISKDDTPIGGRPGTGAYAAKDEQPIGGARRRSVREEQPPSISEAPPDSRGGGAYAAKDEKPVGGGARGSSTKDDQPIGGRPGTGAYAAKDDQPIGGRPGTGAYAAKDDQPIGGRPGTGAYAAKDDQPIGSSRGRSAPSCSGAGLSQELKEGGSRRGSLVEDTEATNEEDGEVDDGEEEDQVMLRAGTGAFLAKDEKPVGRARVEGQEEAPEQEEARVACPKCSRQFASSRIDKHTKVCKVDPNAVPEEKPEPKLTPKPPPRKIVETPVSPAPESGARRKTFAERQMEAMEAKFQACGKCSRKFAPDRIAKHESVCKGMGVKRPEEDAEAEPVKEEIVEVATPSRERTLSPKKAAPAPPPEGGRRKTFAERQMEAMEAKFQACGKCGRKFAPDRVEKHESVCKGKQPALTRSSAGSAEEADEYSPPAPKSTASSRLDPTGTCSFCKRKYPKDQLEAHESVCQVLLLEDEVVLTATQSTGSKKVQLPAGFKPMQR